MGWIDELIKTASKILKDRDRHDIAHRPFRPPARDADKLICAPDQCVEEILGNSKSDFLSCFEDLGEGTIDLVKQYRAGRSVGLEGKLAWASFVLCLEDLDATRRAALQQCVEHVPCGNACCRGGKAGETCCDGGCCHAGEACCDGTCCAVGAACCAGVCCEPGKVCSNGECRDCPQGQAKCKDSSTPDWCIDVWNNGSGGYCGESCTPCSWSTEVCCDGTCRPSGIWTVCGGGCMMKPPCEDNGKVFSSESCTCECPGITCPAGEVLDPDACACVPAPPVICAGGSTCSAGQTCCQTVHAGGCCFAGQVCDNSGIFPVCK